MKNKVFLGILIVALLILNLKIYRDCRKCAALKAEMAATHERPKPGWLVEVSEQEYLEILADYLAHNPCSTVCHPSGVVGLRMSDLCSKARDRCEEQFRLP